MPVAAVRCGGKLEVSAGSSTAMVGMSGGATKSVLRPVARMVMTAPRPTSLPVNTAYGPIGGAGTILDALRFIEHDQVKLHVAGLEKIGVADHQLVIGDLYQLVRHVPQPLPPTPVSLDRGHRQLGGPHLKFSLPVSNQWLGADQQYVFQFAGEHQ